MGGGGSSSSSSSSSSTTNIDKRLVVDNGVGVSSDSSTVNVSALDNGAVTAGTDLAKKALDSIVTADAQQGQSLDNIIGLAGKLFDGGFAMLKSSQDATNAAYSTATDLKTSTGTLDQRTIVILGISAAAAVVAINMGRKK